jgi:PPP family 3-phenylpropionic acid transporter
VLGILLPYFNLYCYHLGFTGFQIGLLSSARTLATVIFPLLWGVLADHFQIRKPIFVLCQFLSTAIWAFYLWTTDFHWMLLITICYGIFYAPLISFLEAFAMAILGKAKQNYGHIRVWGSLSFIGMVLLIGKVVEIYPIRVIIILILAGSICQALLSTRLQDPDGRQVRRLQADVFRGNARAFYNRRMLVFLTAAFLMLASHGAYYGFFSIHLEALGYKGSFIGIAWALAALAEILVMLRSEWIFQRTSLEKVFFFSFMVAAFRWIFLFYVTGPLWILVSQLLHAVTYGAFHVASILYMDQLTPKDVKTFGQALNNAVTYGMGMMIGFFLNGYLYEIIGLRYLFLISSLAALAGGLLFRGWGMPRKPKPFP